MVSRVLAQLAVNGPSEPANCPPFALRSARNDKQFAQIKPSIEEAAINLGALPLSAFVKLTVPLILPSMVVGALLSFITAINELSSTLILYTSGTATMPVKIYISVLDGEFGLAAALSTILLVSTRV